MILLENPFSDEGSKPFPSLDVGGESSFLLPSLLSPTIFPLYDCRDISLLFKTNIFLRVPLKTPTFLRFLKEDPTNRGTKSSNYSEKINLSRTSDLLPSPTLDLRRRDSRRDRPLPLSAQSRTLDPLPSTLVLPTVS